MSIFKLSVLGFLFVSFRSIRFHSHSRYTGDSLCPLSCVRFFVGTFSWLSTFFRSFQSASDYLDLWAFFSLLLDVPTQRVIDAYLPLRYSLFPCFPSDCGTQRSAIPFSDHCFVSQNYFNVSAFPFGLQLILLGLRFRIRLVGIRIFLFRGMSQLFFLVLPKQLRYINNIQHTCQQLFYNFLQFFRFFYHFST